MVKGKFKDIAFVELLQMMHLTRKTGRLEVMFENKWAMVIFKEGTIWHVEPRGFRGASAEEILYALIALTDGDFGFQRVQVLPALERTVNISMETLIMEGVKRMDEENALAAEMTSDDGQAAASSSQLTHLLKFKPGAEAKVRYVPQTVKRILQLIDGQRTIADVIQQSQLDAAQAAQIIKELITQDVIEQIDPKIAAPAPPSA
jgi:hypothetical protein